MFCKDVRCEPWVSDSPPIKIGGYERKASSSQRHDKMLDVIRALKKAYEKMQILLKNQ